MGNHECAVFVTFTVLESEDIMVLLQVLDEQYQSDPTNTG